MKKSQSTLEILITYSWAILAVLISLGTLSYYVYTTKFCPPHFHVSNNMLTAEYHKFIGSDSAVEDVRNLFYVIVKNNLQDPLTVTSIIVKKGDTTCGTFSLGNGVTLGEEEETHLLQGSLTNEGCYGKVNSCYNFDLLIEYKKQSGLAHTAKGSIAGSFEGISDKWKIGEWTSTNYSSRIVRNSNGQTINFCNPEPPPAPSMMNASLPPGIITWNLPGSCSGGFSQVGFANVPCTSVPYLAKGWIHTTFYMDPIFSEHKIFLGGNAVYYDVDAGETKTNGICMNDNLYFYVDGQLVYYGGTTGRMIGAVNTYQSGDEVMRGCGNCQAVDSSAWCIPAFELTTSGFNFGVENSVDILVEDYCTSGGMSPLSVKMV